MDVYLFKKWEYDEEIDYIKTKRQNHLSKNGIYIFIIHALQQIQKCFFVVYLELNIGEHS